MSRPHKRVIAVVVLLGAALAGIVLWAAGRGDPTAAKPAGGPATRPHVLQAEKACDSAGKLLLTWTYYLGPRGERVKHGPETLYYDSGAPKRRIEYVDGEMHGEHVEWDWLNPDIVVLRGQWEHGRRAGTWTEWYKPGRMTAQYSYKDGLRVGDGQYWSVQGVLTWKETFGPPGICRDVTMWYDTGAKQRHCTFDEKGRRHGTWRYWDQHGNLAAEGEWRKGSPRNGVCGVLKNGGSVSQEEFGRYENGSLVERAANPAGHLWIGGLPNE